MSPAPGPGVRKEMRAAAIPGAPRLTTSRLLRQPDEAQTAALGWGGFVRPHLHEAAWSIIEDPEGSASRVAGGNLRAGSLLEPVRPVRPPGAGMLHRPRLPFLQG